MKKLIHIPTIGLHLFLILIAAATLLSHPDIILWAGGIGLIVHLIWTITIVRKGSAPLPICISHALGTVVQFFFLYNLPVPNLGLGSGLAHFFYQIMLAVWTIVLLFGLMLASVSSRNSK